MRCSAFFLLSLLDGASDGGVDILKRFIERCRSDSSHLDELDNDFFGNLENRFLADIVIFVPGGVSVLFAGHCSCPSK